MLCKAIIKDIDFNSNIATVRIPAFESAGSVGEALFEATIAITPGVINSYKEADVVIVGFENGSKSKPMILGKLFVSLAEEHQRGAISCENLKVSSRASIPFSTNFTSMYEIDQAVADAKQDTNIFTNINSVADLINSVHKLELAVHDLSKKLDNAIEELNKTPGK